MSTYIGYGRIELDELPPGGEPGDSLVIGPGGELEWDEVSGGGSGIPGGDPGESLIVDASGDQVWVDVTCHTIAELRALPVTLLPNGTQLNVLGYYAAGDGGGGLFYFNVTSSAADNGGTVIKPTAVSGSGRWLRVVEGSISLKWFGARGNGSTNDTAAVQTAINSSYSLDLVGASYAVSALTQSLHNQCFTSSNGIGTFIKNANGPILTSTGDFVQCHNVKFHGEGFTGDNVTFSGQSCALINCGSQLAAGRAVKATGSHFQILGTCGIYHTSDTTATGYDIEIGIAGTLTLYHQLEGVYTSQPDGGILFVDTGGHCISGGQIGKLTIQAVSSPGGANGGMTKGCRILGDVSVGFSNTNFTGNQFGIVTITFAAMTSGCVFDITNQLATGATIINLGNENNYIQRNVSTGGYQEVLYGEDGGAAIVKVHLPLGEFQFPSLVAPSIAGGTTTTSDLFLKPTTGAGTTGADIHLGVGTDGATEVMTILNAGTVGIGNVGPHGAALHVNETGGTRYGLYVAKSGSSFDAALISNSGTTKASLILVASGGTGARALQVDLQNATAIGLRVKGWTAHSGNLAEFRDVSDALLSFIGPTGALTVPDQAYDASAWDGNLSVPTKNAVRDAIVAIGGAATLSGYLTSSQPTTSTTAVNITGMSFAIAAGEVWAFQFYILLTNLAGADTKFALDIPTAATVGAQVRGSSTSSLITADATLSAGVVNTATGSVIISGIVSNGVNAGTVQLMFASTSGASTTVNGTGTHFIARKMN